MAQPLSTLPKIMLVHGTASEQQAREMLLRWLERYMLDKWLYTRVVQIEEGAIPHSHPVLTLSPRTRWNDYLADPEQLLAAYLHEQLHWFTLLEEQADIWDRLAVSRCSAGLCSSSASRRSSSVSWRPCDCPHADHPNRQCMDDYAFLDQPGS